MTFEEWCDKERLYCTYSYQLDSLEDAWNARVPEGYVIVPVEPTKKMLDEASDKAVAEYIYKAMVQAAQEEE